MNEEFDDFMVITRNAAKCTVCGDEIDSKHRHDFVSCSCGAISIDGGKDYIKWSVANLSDIINLCEARPFTLEEIEGTIQRYEDNAKDSVGDYYKKRLVVAERYKQYLLQGEGNDKRDSG